MPGIQFIAAIRGIQINESREVSLAIYLKCSLLPDPELCCPDCQQKSFRVKSYVIREVKHAVWSGKLILLHVKVPKFGCKVCHRFFMQPNQRHSRSSFQIRGEACAKIDVVRNRQIRITIKAKKDV